VRREEARSSKQRLLLLDPPRKRENGEIQSKDTSRVSSLQSRRAQVVTRLRGFDPGSTGTFGVRVARGVIGVG
jgi:hypothetical protein